MRVAEEAGDTFIMETVSIWYSIYRTANLFIRCHQALFGVIFFPMYIYTKGPAAYSAVNALVTHEQTATTSISSVVY